MNERHRRAHTRFSENSRDEFISGRQRNLISVGAEEVSIGAATIAASCAIASIFLAGMQVERFLNFRKGIEQTRREIFDNKPDDFA